MPLIPLLLGLAPTVASWIMGDKTGAAVSKVTDIARDILGTTDADGIERAVAADPNLALQFKMAVLQAEADARNHAERMKQQEIDEVKAGLADVQSARSQTVELAKMKSPLAYGPVVVSVMSIVLAGAVVALPRLIPEVGQFMSETDKSMLLVAAVGWVAIVQNYWLGSSRGSSEKDSMIAAALAKKG